MFLRVCVGGVKPPMEVKKMVSLERFNKKSHRYIYSVQWISGVNCGYSVRGRIGTRFYIMYPLKEAITRYNAEAKSN